MSQNQKIIECLSRHTGAWVTLPYLMIISGSANVHSRISELRSKGYDIKQENDPHYKGNDKHSQYMLIDHSLEL